MTLIIILGKFFKFLTKLLGYVYRSSFPNNSNFYLTGIGHVCLDFLGNFKRKFSRFVIANFFTFYNNP